MQLYANFKYCSLRNNPEKIKSELQKVNYMLEIEGISKAYFCDNYPTDIPIRTDVTFDKEAYDRIELFSNPADRLLIIDLEKQVNDIHIRLLKPSYVNLLYSIKVIEVSADFALDKNIAYRLYKMIKIINNNNKYIPKYYKLMHDFHKEQEEKEKRKVSLKKFKSAKKSLDAAYQRRLEKLESLYL